MRPASTGCSTLLRRSPSWGVKAFAKEIVKTRGKNDLTIIKEIFSPANPNLCDHLTIRVVKSIEDSYEVTVTECLLTEVFRNTGAAAYGQACLCRDVQLTRLINPRIVLDLEGTIMEGKPSCMHRWHDSPWVCVEFDFRN
jgi:hypothetical protein